MYPTTPPPFEELSGYGVTLEPYRDEHLPGRDAGAGISRAVGLR